MAIGKGTRFEGDRRAVPQQGITAPVSTSGGRATGSVLSGLHQDWTVLHARHWPGRSYDSVDHIAVGPTGIFVVDTAGWTGPVVITPDVLEVNGRSRLTAVQGAHERAREVALLLAPHVRDHVYPVLCLSRDEAVSGWVKAVRVCSMSTFDELIGTPEPVLTSEDVTRIAEELDAVLPSSRLSAAERMRASDQTSTARTPEPEVAATPPSTWHRSRVGRITEAALGLGIAAALAVVAIHATALDPASDDGSRQHQPEKPSGRP